MGRSTACRWSAIATALAALQCGSDTSSPLVVEHHTDELFSGHLFHAGQAAGIEFSTQSSAPFAGDVHVRVGALAYDLQYDFMGREVVLDGHGAALERAWLRALRPALDHLTRYLGPNDPSRPMHEQMLFAAFGLLLDSGGISLDRKVIALDPPDEPSVEQAKSLDDDGIQCVQNGASYNVSFDYGDMTVIDAEVQAGAINCSGQCGPACSQITPWRMWTLDCLEHDTCCNVANSDDCWTPLGECGDEFESATPDFLRGFDPFRRHCDGG